MMRLIYAMFCLLSFVLFAQMPATENLKLLLYSKTGVTNVSGHASAWADQSGSINDFAQATENLRPKVVADTLNGWQGVRFNAPGETNRQMKLANKILSSATPKFTIMYYVRVDSIDGSIDQQIWGQTLPNSQIFDTGGLARFEMQYGVPATVCYRGSTNVQEDVLYLVFLIHGGAADSIIVNGVLETGSYRLGSFGAGVSNSASNQTIGSLEDGASRLYHGFLFACAIWTKALTTEEIAQAAAEVAEQFADETPATISDNPPSFKISTLSVLDVIQP